MGCKSDRVKDCVAYVPVINVAVKAREYHRATSRMVSMIRFSMTNDVRRMYDEVESRKSCE